MRISALFLIATTATAALIAWQSIAEADHTGPEATMVREHSPVSAESHPQFVQGEIIVRFSEGASDASIQALNSAHDARTLEVQPLSGLHRIGLPPAADVMQVASAFEQIPIVDQAGPNFVMEAYDAPNDTNYSYQWHLHNTEGGMWAEAAWNIAPDLGQDVIVAVIDTGVAYEDHLQFSHAPDLKATTFVSPKDYVENDEHPNDDNGHGTHVVGTISQDTNDGYGVAGVAPNSSIMPIKVLAQDGSGSGDNLVEAIRYAVDNGADVVNMSLGFPGTGSPNDEGEVCTEIAGLAPALDYAYDSGVTVVAAAGNDGGTTVTCPAAYATVIAVGSTGYDGQRVSYSNTGTALDIVAPGGNPGTDLNGDGFSDGVLQETFCYDWAIMYIYYIVYGLNLYGEFCDVFYHGTSMAAPHVAGTAALLLSANPALTPDEVRFYIESTSRDRGDPGWDDQYGWGLLDAHAALTALTGGLGSATPTPTPVPTPTPTPTPAPTPTPTSAPTPSVTPTPTPTPTPMPTPTSTPTPAPANALHVGDIDGTGVKLQQGAWKAIVTITIHDSDHAPVAGAVVSGTFYQSTSVGPLSCTTGASGSCSIDSGQLPSKQGKASFTIETVTHASSDYDPSNNHDVDGDSDGTTISLSK